jgi:hypothetical protein
LKHKYESLVGNEINGLKIIRFFRTNNGVRGARKRSYYECICICGKLFTSRSDHIKNGSSKSCGCITYKLAAKGHTLPNNQGAINDMYRGYGSGAKQRGLAFLLLKNEFENLIFKDCFYCGTPPSIRVWKVDKITPYNLCCNGIDRVNSNFGYTSDNCVSCCPQCNYAKSDLSLEDFRKWISQIVAFNTKPEAK